MVYKKFLISVGTLAVISMFALTHLQAEEKSDDSYDALVVAKVGDKEVKYGDLNKWIKMMPPSYQSMFSDTEQMKKLLDRQINNILFSDEAIRLKLYQKPDVKDKIEEFTKGILMQALVEEKVNKNITVSDKEVEEYYNSNQDEFKILVFVRGHPVSCFGVRYNRCLQLHQNILEYQPGPNGCRAHRGLRYCLTPNVRGNATWSSAVGHRGQSQEI